MTSRPREALPNPASSRDLASFARQTAASILRTATDRMALIGPIVRAPGEPAAARFIIVSGDEDGARFTRLGAETPAGARRLRKALIETLGANLDVHQCATELGLVSAASARWPGPGMTVARIRRWIEGRATRRTQHEDPP